MKRLLVVDDYDENLYLMQILLESQGFEVALAHNGAEALEKARLDPPDLIISDILMPVMDGFTLCRRWKADDCLSRVPLVFYTATYTDPKDEQLALALGADAFVAKPAEPEDFIAMVLAVLARAEARKMVSPQEPESEDGSLLQQYSEALVRKLEDKMLQLERANDALKREIAEREQVEEAERHRLAELEALHTVSSALRTARTHGEALRILLDETLAALETDAGIVWLYHPETNELHAAVASGWFQSFALAPLRPGEGIAGTVFASGQMHVSEEFAGDPLAAREAAGRHPPEWGGVCLPIRFGETTIGTLVIAIPPGRHATTEQVNLLESLAEMGGAALHRMSLFEETQRRLGQLQAMHLVDQAISSSTDLRITLDLLLEHVVTQLQVDATDVLLLDPHALTLERAAGRGFRTRAAERARIRLDEGPAGRAVLERRAVHGGSPAQMQGSPRLTALQSTEGFVTYYAVPLIAKGQVVGVLEVFHRAPLSARPDWVDLIETLAGQAAIAIENAQLFEGMQRSNLDLVLAYDATIEGWSHALDLRDKETEGHTQRVTEMTMRLAKALGVPDADVVHMRRGALLHDIGKMGVPDAILLKPGPLSEEEWVVMRRHPELAHELLAPITYLRPALDIPYCHHERWDGTGYPRGLAGEQIPLIARLFAVVDVWDAVRSDRPYRRAWTEKQALAHIRDSAGTHFDPRVVEVFLDIVGAA